MTLRAPDSVCTNQDQSPAAAPAIAATLIRSRGLLARLRGEDSGQDLIEYALAAAMIGLTAVSSMAGFANNISNAFDDIGSAVAGAASSASPNSGGSSGSTGPSNGGNRGGNNGGHHRRGGGGFGGGFGGFHRHH